MVITSTLKFAVGCLFLVLGLFSLWQSRTQRGFGQKRQLGLLLLAAGAVFIALGLGLSLR